jgi:hypothetical protein
MWKRAAETFGVALLIVAGAFYFWSERISDPTWLRSGTKIEIRATAGAVAIVGSETKDVEVTIDGEPASARGARVMIDKGRVPMRVSISDIPETAHVEVRVPADASIAVNMSAGELRIRGMRGDIGSLLRSGRMVVEIDDSKTFRTADGSVLAGAIQAPAFQRNKGGMFRRFIWAGTGRNTLRAHVTTGQLVVQ